jgi:6-phosphogluconolactonase
MPTSPNVFIFDTPEQLATAAAERFVDCANKSRVGLHPFSIALSGGNTPRGVYELLASDRYSKRVEWQRIHLFFGDERCVPPEHPHSNYHMIYETLISKVPIPAANVHRMMAELEPKSAAGEYENELKEFFTGLPWPRFDLIFLGMGSDGHTASLFPGAAALEEDARWVVPAVKGPSQENRITLTVPALSHAANTMFLVTGSDKADMLAEILEGPTKEHPLPAQLIKPLHGSLAWLIDRQAAVRLVSSARTPTTRRR